jgi:hypothetical protein
MSRVFLPPNVSRELLEEREAREARAFEAIQSRDDQAWVDDFNKELRRIDDYLQLVWCPDPAPIDAIAAGAKPGRFHVARHNPGAPVSLIPIETPDGEFRQPDSSVFEDLRRADLWSSSNAQERRRVRRELDLARERREVHEREERAAMALEMWKAVSRTQVSMNSSVPWAQNHQGAKRRGQG